MRQKTVSLDITHSGQPRAYADSVYEGTFTFSWQPAEAEVRSFAKLMLYNFYETPPHPFAPTLERCERQSPENWLVRIVAPYTD